MQLGAIVLADTKRHWRRPAPRSPLRACIVCSPVISTPHTCPASNSASVRGRSLATTYEESRGHASASPTKICVSTHAPAGDPRCWWGQQRRPSGMNSSTKRGPSPCYSLAHHHAHVQSLSLASTGVTLRPGRSDLRSVGRNVDRTILLDGKLSRRGQGEGEGNKGRQSQFISIVLFAPPLRWRCG